MNSIETDRDPVEFRNMVSPTRPRLRLRLSLPTLTVTNRRCLALQISSEVSGSFRDLLLVLLRGERDESAEGDPEAAEAQAEALHDTDGRSRGQKRLLVMGAVDGRWYTFLWAGAWAGWLVVSCPHDPLSCAPGNYGDDQKLKVQLHIGLNGGWHRTE